ncbi:glycosyltransferase [Curtobacterium sp. MCPF17_050]|uniref:glycosyltransferase n=1 Tax=Curtobacterium sp. MCPF17_050 TaxID=2175664 RepID=UPI0011B43032|nr:glycosyltransferase [Curtobacterium sp. MCPF17_050]WIB16064.1 glycosyltransferase [Curtobacterium sp. MCPF17_050]
MTWAILLRERPKLIVVMQPPPLSLIAISPYVLMRRPVVVGDLHSGVFFDPKWSWAKRWVLRFLKKHGGAIVPNLDLADFCEAAGVSVRVSHGNIAEVVPVVNDTATSVVPEGPFALVPFTYARDEPIAALLDAARLVPTVTWVLTGRAPDSVKAAAPSNVVFTGFVNSDEYGALCSKASVMLALTTMESTMQSAGYEALNSGTPLITSPTRVLRDYFEEGALYTQLNAEAIARSVATAVANRSALREKMMRRRQHLVAAQDAGMQQVREWLLELPDFAGQRR